MKGLKNKKILVSFYIFSSLLVKDKSLIQGWKNACTVQSWSQKFPVLWSFPRRKETPWPRPRKSASIRRRIFTTFFDRNGKNQSVSSISMQQRISWILKSSELPVSVIPFVTLSSICRPSVDKLFLPSVKSARHRHCEQILF